MSSESVIESLLGHAFKLEFVLWPLSPELLAVEEPCLPQPGSTSVGTTNAQGSMWDFAKEWLRKPLS